MALKTNLNLQFYFENRGCDVNKYADILTEEQLSEIQNSIVKSFVINDAYAKIDKIDGDKEGINFRVDFYKDNTKLDLLQSNGYSFVPDVSSTAKNFIQQAYEYLKTLSDFTGAVDLFDEGQTA